MPDHARETLHIGRKPLFTIKRVLLHLMAGSKEDAEKSAT